MFEPPSDTVPPPRTFKAALPDTPPLTLKMRLLVTVQDWPAPKMTGDVIVRLVVAAARLMPLVTANVFTPPMETAPEGLSRFKAARLKFVFNTVARFAVEEALKATMEPFVGAASVVQSPPVSQEVPLPPVQARGLPTTRLSPPERLVCSVAKPTAPLPVTTTDCGSRPAETKPTLPVIAAEIMG